MGDEMKKIKIILFVSILMMMMPLWGDEESLDILVIGSDKVMDTSESAFSPVIIADRLRDILSADKKIEKKINVVLDNYYKSKKGVVTGYGTFKPTCYSHTLVQHYYWPDGRDDRLKNLRGESGTDWDYVVMMDDAYMLANTPGYHAEGVNAITEEVLSGGAVPLLLMQWPGSGSKFTTAHLSEISYRVGDGAGATVVPAGNAWHTLKKKDEHANHPTPDGAYLAAASIYSEIFKRSASDSDYSYNDTIADHVWSSAQAERDKTHYTGKYSFLSPICFGKNFDRHVNFNHSGTSTESGTSRNLLIMLERMKMTCKPYHLVFKKTVPEELRPTAFNYGRSWGFEPGKRYRPDPTMSRVSFSYAFQDSGKNNAASLSHLYAIDKRGNFFTGTEGRVIRDILTKGELAKGARCVPDRIMWCKLHDIDPTYVAVHGHKKEFYLAASAAYMVTLLSGRCPISKEPPIRESGVWHSWRASVVGYKTAVRMCTLQGRASGFQVLPSSESFTDLILSKGMDTETMTVQFRLPPQKNVTVTVSIDTPGAASITTPKTLVFTPKNYETPQTVGVKALPGTDYAVPFNVIFKTKSDDPVYHDLYDQWKYTVIRSAAIAVTGNSHPVLSGDATPSAVNHTEFGYATPGSTSVIREFTISNSIDSKVDLDLSGKPAISITSKTKDFTIVKQPTQKKVVSGSSVNFSVQFNPSSLGRKRAEISIANNDHDDNPYTFTIQGAGVKSAPVVNNDRGATHIIDNDATLRGTLSGGLYASIQVYWGKKDGGTTPEQWDNVKVLHGIAEGDFSLDVDNLDFATTYYYRVCADNKIDSSWSPKTSSFVSDQDIDVVDDFIIHRGVIRQAVGELRTTLTNGVDYKLSPSTNPSKAFIRIVNSHFVGGGNSTQNANISGISEYVRIVNPGNLVTSIDFVRSAPNPKDNREVDLTVFWEIVEYVGPDGGPNEIIVRHQDLILGKDHNDVVLTGNPVNTISDINRIVVFITAISGEMHTADITESKQPVFTRVSKNWSVPNVSYAVVEFTGSNWKDIQRIEHKIIYDRRSKIVHKSINEVDLNRTFFHVQHRSKSGFNAPMKQTVGVWFGGPDKLSFTTHKLEKTTVAVVWVIENKEFHPRLGAKVQHLTSSHFGNPGLYGPETWSKTILPVTAMNNTSIVGTAVRYIVGRTESTKGSIVSPSLTAVDKITLWQATAETDVNCWFSVVEWPKSFKPKE